MAGMRSGLKCSRCMTSGDTQPARGCRYTQRTILPMTLRLPAVLLASLGGWAMLAAAEQGASTPRLRRGPVRPARRHQPAATGATRRARMRWRRSPRAPARVARGRLRRSHRASSKRSCVTCHSDRAKAGGLSLASFDVAKAAESVEVTEKMIRKLRAGMMPPAGREAARKRPRSRRSRPRSRRRWTARRTPTARVGACSSA